MSSEGGSLSPIGFAALGGWAEDDHAAAWHACRLSAERIAAAPPKTRALGIDGAALAAVAEAALALPADLDRAAARSFFEAAFEPHEGVAGDGFFTGYYEPEAEASLTPDARFAAPLLRPPEELVEIDETAPPPGLPEGMRFARRTASGFEPFFDRGAIMAGALDGRGWRSPGSPIRSTPISSMSKRGEAPSSGWRPHARHLCREVGPCLSCHRPRTDRIAARCSAAR